MSHRTRYSAKMGGGDNGISAAFGLKSLKPLKIRLWSAPLLRNRITRAQRGLNRLLCSGCPVIQTLPTDSATEPCEEVSVPARYRPDHCPQCEARQALTAHGFYSRTLVDATFDGTIRVRARVRLL